MKTQCFAKTYYIDEHSDSARKELSNILFRLILNIQKEREASIYRETTDNRQCAGELVFLCIGSDRVTGDSLGPMIGYQLSKKHLPGVSIYGTLEHPVHALNLAETAEYIEYAHPGALVVALDASLGSRKHQGYVTVGKGQLFPGAGVKKNLVPVGDIYITGIINVSGSFEYLALQTTRLSTVMRMADCISGGILLTCQKYYLKRACDSNPELFDHMEEHIYDGIQEAFEEEEGNALFVQECAVGNGYARLGKRLRKNQIYSE